MKKCSLLITIVVLGCLATGQSVRAAIAEKDEQPLIQLAILLDTSGSMSGLIEQAKTELWRIVNEFATAKRDGKRPEFQVALYEYGKSGLSAEGGYIRQIVPLSNDLDKISEELFALKTNGGSEFCGWVIKEAVRQLEWSTSHKDLKTVYVCGNEPFTQGQVDYKESCRAAIGKGITVNTIFCGGYQQGVNTQWKDGAMLADGSYASIDHNRKVAHIAAPQDAEIARLGKDLNKTYIAYGAKGKANSARQDAQDANARKASPAAETQRAVSKATVFYRNDAWDLVDAVKNGKVKPEALADIPVADLPEEMREMDAKERQAFVEQNAKQRADVQAKIQKLNAARNKFVANERKKQAADGEETLDQAMSKSLRQQAEKKGFAF